MEPIVTQKVTLKNNFPDANHLSGEADRGKELAAEQALAKFQQRIYLIMKQMEEEMNNRYAVTTPKHETRG